MKKRTIRIALILCIVMSAALIAGCADDQPSAPASTPAPAADPAPAPADPATPADPAAPEVPPEPEPLYHERAFVRASIHRNGPGASLVAIAEELGYFDMYGIDADITIVESGPVQMAAMRADNHSLDFGYIGPGVAWNPMDPSGNQISFIFFDQLGNSERLIARTGIFTANASGVFDHNSVYNGLRGQTVYMEVGTTPGGWFKNLLSAINDGRPVDEQLWLTCEDPAYMQGYEAPNQNPENMIQVVNLANANIPAGMATAGRDRVDIAVAFEPIPSTIVANISDVEVITDNRLLPPEKVFPGTFVARNEWIDENPDVVQRVVNALFLAALWRADNLDEAMRIAERLCQAEEGSFPLSVYCLTLEDYQTWFSSPDGRGFGYLRSLYNERIPNVPEGLEPKPFEDVFDFSFMLNAIANLSP